MSQNESKRLGFTSLIGNVKSALPLKRKPACWMEASVWPCFRARKTEPEAFLTSYPGRSEQGPKKGGQVAVTQTAPGGESISQGGADSSKM
jgi:hypothetical protein